MWRRSSSVLRSPATTRSSAAIHGSNSSNSYVYGSNGIAALCTYAVMPANSDTSRSASCTTSTWLSSSAGCTSRVVSYRSLHASRMMMLDKAYNHTIIEDKWRTRWNNDTATNTSDDNNDNDTRPKFYSLAMFPYPSGALHMGHVRVYSISDSLARLHRMRGYRVIHPMGWDAFGLPAENAAIERGISPATWTRSNIAHMKSQLAQLGFSFDWHREIATCDPEYYRWTQWLFLQLQKDGMAYQRDANVNWDPIDQTVLANEQVDATGRSWRSGAIVERRKLRQWFFKVTQYTNELLKGLDTLEGWPHAVKQMQRQWINQLEGAIVNFKIAPSSSSSVSSTSSTTPSLPSIDVFTSRAETINGVSFLVLAPDHSFVQYGIEHQLFSTQKLAEIAAYQKRTVGIPEVERTKKEVQPGVHLDVYAINPITGDRVPIYIASYVVAEVGTGAVMGVPGHDARDAHFARMHTLPVRSVIHPLRTTDIPVDGRPYTGDGTMINCSDDINGMTATLARTTIVNKLTQSNQGRAYTHYRLNDWLVSRQRYWGAPIPMIHCQSCGAVPVPDDQLPVRLPDNIKFTGRGPSPLASADAAAWRNVACPCCGKPAQRDTDTLDTFVDSSWYFLRYLSPKRTDVLVDPKASAKWMPVDLYVGGIEHAILHLLYARFLTRFLHHKGLVPSAEPFPRLLTQGMVHGKTYRHPITKLFVKPDAVEFTDDQPYTIEKSATGESRVALEIVWEKMSKSKYNGVDPSDAVRQFGADTTRLYILFKAPPSQVLDWNTTDIVGQARWMTRLWELFSAHIHAPVTPPVTSTATVAPVVTGEPKRQLRARAASMTANLPAAEAKLREQMNTAIETVTLQLSSNVFNVAIANLMKFSRQLTDFELAQASTCHYSPAYQQGLRTLCTMLAPFAPHVAAEFWEALALRQYGGDVTSTQRDVHQQSWPVVTRSDTNSNNNNSNASQMVVVQINGETRHRVSLPLLIAADDTKLMASVITLDATFSGAKLDFVRRTKGATIINLKA